MTLKFLNSSSSALLLPFTQTSSFLSLLSMGICSGMVLWFDRCQGFTDPRTLGILRTFQSSCTQLQGGACNVHSRFLPLFSMSFSISVSSWTIVTSGSPERERESPSLVFLPHTLGYTYVGLFPIVDLFLPGCMLQFMWTPFCRCCLWVFGLAILDDFLSFFGGWVLCI